MEEVENNYFKDTCDGLESMMTFDAEDAKMVVDRLWSKLKVKPGLELHASEVLKPHLSLAVESMKLTFSADGSVNLEFKTLAAKDSYNMLVKGGSWFSAFDILGELGKLYG